MSVQTEISRLESAKQAIASAIANKGVTVPDGTMLDGMAALIESIVAGGGGEGYKVATGSFTPTSANIYSNPITVSGIGFSPKVVILAVTASVTDSSGRQLIFGWAQNLDDVEEYLYLFRYSSSNNVNTSNTQYYIINFLDDGFELKAKVSSYSVKKLTYKYIVIG